MDNFLHSIHHKIDIYKTTIEIIGHDKKRLQNFFDNYFNETGHNEYKAFFEALIDFMVAVYQDTAIEKKSELIYATLRFIKFVQGDKK